MKNIEHYMVTISPFTLIIILWFNTFVPAKRTKFDILSMYNTTKAVRINWSYMSNNIVKYVKEDEIRMRKRLFTNNAPVVSNRSQLQCPTIIMIIITRPS